MIFQNFNLIPTMTARENVSLALAFGGLRGQQRRARSRELLARVGLGDRLSSTNLRSFPAANNSASRSRARSQTIRKCCWRMSRPAISTRFARTSCSALLRDMVNQDALTILMVTHDHELANSFADRIVFMKDGVVV